MALDLASIAVGLGTAALTALGLFFAPKYKRDESKIQAEIERAKLLQTAEDNFQTRVFTALEKSEAKIDQLNERINAQALEIAKLTGKVQTLEYSESALKLENARLLSENTHLKQKVEELDDENILQSQKIAELNGRLAALTPTPGGTP
ncbi:hypothetical protein [Deinococcus ruber]|uniref:Uncharacterized protein n=1 Tax=Deinococcus ruber TaxID=1848197 RepID=A0A918F4K7_9DEIO|nr:hypothetical protein [Deinococcus ruber]GGR00396.1 hypothetical protein GCM10008957_11490 [Deinococcus ruber]